MPFDGRVTHKGPGGFYVTFTMLLFYFSFTLRSVTLRCVTIRCVTLPYLTLPCVTFRFLTLLYFIYFASPYFILLCFFCIKHSHKNLSTLRTNHLFISILIATDIANHQHQSLKIHQRSIPLPAHRKTGTIPFSTRQEGRGSRTSERQGKSQGDLYAE